MDRDEKQAFVAELHQTFKQTAIVVVSHYSGLTVAEMGRLRRQVRDAGGSVKVTKNRLVLRALPGTQYEQLAPLFSGPTAIAYAEDPVAVAKVAVEFARTNAKLVLLGGAVGEAALDANGVKALATLPSLDELRARIVGLVCAPATRIAGILQAPAGQIARVLAAHAEEAGERAAA